MAARRGSEKFRTMHPLRFSPDTFARCGMTAPTTMALEYAQKVGYGEWLGNAEPRFVSKKTSGPKSGSLSREETSRGPALKNQNAASGAGLDSSSSAAGKSCNQGDKEYHQENEEQEFR